jgi:hypothetical protein
MDANYKAYDYLASFQRIDDILAQPSSSYEEVNSLCGGFTDWCADVSASPLSNLADIHWDES